MTEVQHKYTPEDLIKLNNKKHCSISPELITFFGKFPKAKVLGNSHVAPYKNPYNIYLNEINKRNKVFKAPEAFTDDKIVADLKEIATKITDQNKEEIIGSFLKITMSDSCYTKVADMLHSMAIDCIFLVSVYVDLFKAISQNNTKLYDILENKFKDQLYHPREFDSSMDEIACETSVQKRNKWRLHNSILMSHFYLKDMYNSGFIINDMLVPIINGIKVEDPYNIEILKEILPLIKTKLTKGGSNLSDIFNRLEKISKDKSYPARLRFLLMDIIEGK